MEQAAPPLVGLRHIAAQVCIPPGLGQPHVAMSQSAELPRAGLSADPSVYRIDSGFGLFAATPLVQPPPGLSPRRPHSPIAQVGGIPPAARSIARQAPAAATEAAIAEAVLASPPPPIPVGPPPPPPASTETWPASNAAAAARPSAANVVKWVQPTIAAHPPVQPREGPRANSAMQIWTAELALDHVGCDVKMGVSHNTAHKFMSEWCAGGSFPARHVEDLTHSSEFDWLAYLVVHPYRQLVFGETGIVRFEIRYLMPRDSNTNDLRCDFVAYRPNGAGIRLHPNPFAEDIPVVVTNIRSLAADWTLLDPLPRLGVQAQTFDHALGPVYLNVSNRDTLTGRDLSQWLDDEASSGKPLRDITERPLGHGADWFPWPLLLASTRHLAFLIESGVLAVASCRLRAGGVGIMVRRADDGTLVTIAMRDSKLVVYRGREVASEVSEVASKYWTDLLQRSASQQSDSPALAASE